MRADLAPAVRAFHLQNVAFDGLARLFLYLFCSLLIIWVFLNGFIPVLWTGFLCFVF